ncbi:GGDEF domain-containing protein [Jiella endophytica]|uniref:diguanylate cyclase n=1 Tax=Jiella endophytica TaxID=2558362 RepID=A0A4Y8RJR2_9HYPH|nr:GGDEF domain-containing protein [Jiella endophytica]TFF22067.1 GGDEF domain-containing protein [Jiella endophytica]
MSVNIQLVLFLAMGTCLIAGVAMLSEWRNFRDPAAAWWSAGFLLSAVGACLFPFREYPGLDILSIGLSNALFLASYSVICAGIGEFAGRRPSLPLALVPGLVWLLFWGFVPIAADFDARVIAMSVATAFISGVSAWIGFTSRINRLARALAVVMALRAGFFCVRTVWAAGAFGPISDAARSFGFQVVIIEGLWTSVLLGYLMLALLREKRESSLIKLAETDFLTGADNRRAFQMKAEMAVRHASERRVTTLMVLDLDHFKRINDAYGHGFGDTVLKHFADIVMAQLGPADTFARLGGEEFALVLPDRDEAEGLRAAEAIRIALAATRIGDEESAARATVSIGLVTTRHGRALVRLLDLADEALYRAKANGRNRVECVDLGKEPATAEAAVYRLSA